MRLKGGDPFVFGRGGEEARALARAGVPFRIVPGLTAGLTAAALAGIPATTRETNHAIILATGHRALDERSIESWEAIARTGQPIVLYMAMANLAEIAAAFQRAGMAPDTPVTILALRDVPRRARAGDGAWQRRRRRQGARARAPGRRRRRQYRRAAHRAVRQLSWEARDGSWRLRAV